MPIVITIRSVALLAARGHGAVYRWLRTDWRPAAILALGIAEALWIGEQLFGQTPGSWFQWSTVLGLYGLALASILMWSARSRVTIEEFVWSDASVEQKEVRLARGLSIALVAKLAELVQLFEPVDEDRSIGTALGRTSDSALRAGFSVENLSGLLRDTVSAESKLGLGPLQVPVGAVLALFGRLAQGPRIVGTVYVETGHVSLVAQLSGTGSATVWSTGTLQLTQESGAATATAFEGLLNELALRIFSDLALDGRVRWTAVRCFTDGLRLYRASLRTSKDSRLNRQNARKQFVDTLAEDDAMSLVYYNLGIVYSELAEERPDGSSSSADDRDAARAEAAFREAIRHDPGRPEPYYALAMQLSVALETRHDEVIELCRRVVQVAPRHTEGYDLLGLAQRAQADQEYATQGVISSSHRIQAVARNRERAAALAWASIFWAALRGQEPERRTIALAHKTHRGLGVAYAELAASARGPRRWFGFLRATMALREALRFAPAHAETHQQVGRILSDWGMPASAAAHFRIAAQIAPSAAEYRARWARAEAQAGHVDTALRESRRIQLTSATGSKKGTDSVVDIIAETYEACRSPREAARARLMREELRGIRVKPGSRSLRKALLRFRRQERQWEAGQCAVELGTRQLDEGHAKQASQTLELAIILLGKSAPAEIRDRELHVTLARAYRLSAATLRPDERDAQSRLYTDALKEVRQARRLDVVSAAPLVELAEIHAALGDHANARDARLQALVSRPDDPELHFSLGVTCWNLASGLRGATRDAMLKEARKYLEGSRELYPPEVRGWAEYWLGRLQTEAGEYEDALTQLTIGRARGVAPINGGLLRAQALLRNRQYNEAETAAREVIQAGERMLAKGAGVDDLLTDETYDPTVLGSRISYAYWVLGYSYAQRGVLDHADAAITKGLFYAVQLSDPDQRRPCEATCWDCRGWVAYQRGDLDRARTELSKSIVVLADSEAYLHLGLTYVAMRARSGDAPEKERLNGLAGRCASLSAELDLTDEFADERKRLELAIQSK